MLGLFSIALKKIMIYNCHEGVVIPETYKNIHGQVVKIDPQNLDPNPEVIRF